jgi:hypothetical protein
MMYAFEMDPGAMTYTCMYIKFHKDWFRYSKVDKGIHSHTNSVMTS